MRPLPWLMVLLAALCLAGCSKKSSKEFHRLSSEQEVLVARDGDDAWVSPEMATILSGLEAVPANALEHDRAVALVDKLKAERARVEAEKAALAEKPKPASEDPFAGRTFGAPPPTAATPEPLAAAPEGAEDGGAKPAAEPWAGMPEAEFSKRFGACMTAGAKTKLANGDDAVAAYEVAATADCQKKFGGPQADGRTMYLFGPKGLAEKATFAIGVVDGGQLVIPGRQPPTPDPGPPSLAIPGAPLPEGVDAGQ